jgi:voltage-gated sodium channel
MANTLTLLRNRADAFVENQRIQYAITGLILLNAVTLGLATVPAITIPFGAVLHTIDAIIITCFVVELALRLFSQGWRFFLSGWNIFDFLIIGVTLIPATGNLSVLRTLRVLRVLRLVSVVPTMRKVVNALLMALPGLGSIGALLLLVFYVASVMSTQMFGAHFPEWFGDIGASMYTLFQIMTLESWSMGIVRPVMEIFPLAWIFFVPFILLTSFAVLNLFIAIIVDAMQHMQAEETAHIEEDAHQEREAISRELSALRTEIIAMREHMEQERPREKN